MRRKWHRIGKGIFHIIYGSNKRKFPLISHRLHDRPCFTLIQIVQRIHVILAEFKVKDIRVLFDATLCIALRQRYPAFLQAVPNQDLGDGLVVTLSELR